MTPDEKASEEKSSRSYWGFVLWPVAVIVLMLLCQGCGSIVKLGSKDGKSGTFDVSYDDAKTRLNQMKNGTQWGRKLGINQSEPVPGQRYILSIHEGGSPPAMSTTEIQVCKTSDTSCLISVSSWTDNIIFPSHKAWSTLRRRWREMSKLLGPS